MPETIAGLLAWWRADVGISTNYWADATGRHVVDGTGHLPGTNASNSNLNNRPTTTYNGTSQYFTGAPELAEAIDSSSAATVLVVADRGATGAYHTMVSAGEAGSSNNYIWLAVDSANKLFYRRLDTGAGDDVGITSVLAGGYYCCSRYDGSNHEWFLNGSADGSPAANTKAPVCEFFSIGALRRSTVNNYFSGEIAEVIVYSRAVSDGELAQLNQYIGARYGL